MGHRPDGVSFVVPVRDGARWLDQTIEAILAQVDGRPVEVLVVDDGSTDGSADVLRRWAATGRVRVLRGAARGAAAAINLGVRHASQPIICQVDQDVVPEAGWMTRVTAALETPDVAAVQGYYATPRNGSLWARVMGLDLECRYARLRRGEVDHVASGHTAYRASALERVGLLDETLGYGYDNDLSYRLGAAGYRLVFCRQARSVHRWREGFLAYLRQQYGVGYGRLDVVAKHPRRLTGDDVSGLLMLLHAPAMLAALALAALAATLALAGGPWSLVALAALGLVSALALERLLAGLEATVRFRDPAGLAFVPAHLARDVVWALALGIWLGRRLRGRPRRPTDSM
jgi:cellulose synthase/poly-beta-1,6-N-acetylglucosamine synthase-like glycosyltransferase